MATFTAVSSGVGRPPRSSIVGAALKSTLMPPWFHHGQLPVGFHEVLEERVCGVPEWDMHVDEVQLPG